MNDDDAIVLTVKQAIPLSKLGKNKFYALLGTRAGPPIKRIGRRILIPAGSFYEWLTTPTKPKRRKK